MMRRGFGIAVVTALLALSLPLSAVVAHGAGSDNGHRGKITVCHKANTAHPVTISISKAAWKAHKAHGDTEGPCPTPVKVPKPAPGTCTFDARTSAYYNGSTNTAPLYATGPISFNWTVATGAVTVPGGFWNELAPPPPAASTTYYNKVASGTVNGTGGVTLSFTRTVPNTYSFSFSGQLTGGTLSGTMDGYFFTATGSVRCGTTGTTAGTCTFDASTSAYYSGTTNGAPLYAVGPIHFAWTVATGVVTVPGGYWNEVAPPIGGTTYPFNITAGSVSGAGAVSLSLLRSSDNYPLSFSGQLTGSTLSGLMSGNWFAATGTVNCSGTTSQHRDDD